MYTLKGGGGGGGGRGEVNPNLGWGVSSRLSNAIATFSVGGL